MKDAAVTFFGLPGRRFSFAAAVFERASVPLLVIFCCDECRSVLEGGFKVRQPPYGPFPGRLFVGSPDEAVMFKLGQPVSDSASAHVA